MSAQAKLRADTCAIELVIVISALAAAAPTSRGESR